MEVWNREELYKEIWAQPLVKVAVKYGISAVMLGKVCRKLQIPLPGRGYWVKKACGNPVKQKPLPEAKNLPVVHRMNHTLAYRLAAEKEAAAAAQPEPTDAEYLRITQVESRTIVVNPEAKRHKLVSAAAKMLARARQDDKGFLVPPWQDPCLDIRVSPALRERVLNLTNAFILVLEAEGFPVSVVKEKYGSTALIFGHRVPFSIVETYHQKRVEASQSSSSWSRMSYTPSGQLEFRVGGDRWSDWKCRETDKRKLENSLPTIVGAMLRDARNRIIQEKRQKQEEMARRQKEIELAELGRQIDEEEKKVQDLDNWVTAWARAQQYREFISALEKVWSEEGIDLSPDSAKGQRIIWMKQQADRLDPMRPSPPSILDRKGELRRW